MSENMLIIFSLHRFLDRHNFLLNRFFSLFFPSSDCNKRNSTNTQWWWDSCLVLRCWPPLPLCWCRSKRQQLARACQYIHNRGIAKQITVSFIWASMWNVCMVILNVTKRTSTATKNSKLMVFWYRLTLIKWTLSQNPIMKSTHTARSVKFFYFLAFALINFMRSPNWWQLFASGAIDSYPALFYSIFTFTISKQCHEFIGLIKYENLRRMWRIILLRMREERENQEERGFMVQCIIDYYSMEKRATDFINRMPFVVSFPVILARVLRKSNRRIDGSDVYKIEIKKAYKVQCVLSSFNLCANECFL